MVAINQLDAKVEEKLTLARDIALVLTHEVPLESVA
jgi:hypothetical protein